MLPPWWQNKDEPSEVGQIKIESTNLVFVSRAAARRLTPPGSSQTHSARHKGLRGRPLASSSRPDQGDSQESVDSLKINTHLPSSLDLFSLLPSSPNTTTAAAPRACVFAFTHLSSSRLTCLTTHVRPPWPRPPPPLIGHAGPAAL